MGQREGGKRVILRRVIFASGANKIRCPTKHGKESAEPREASKEWDKDGRIERRGHGESGVWVALETIIIQTGIT